MTKRDADTFADYRNKVERGEAEPPRRGPGSELSRFLRTAKVTPEIAQIIGDVEESRKGLADHLGGEETLTPVQAELLEAWARSEVLEKLAFREVCTAALSTKTGKIRFAGAAFGKFQKNCRELMEMLGLWGKCPKPNSPAGRPPTTLEGYLAKLQREKKEEEEEE